MLNSNEYSELNVSSNPPLQIAVLGAEGTGKTSFISRLTLNLVHDAYYPTNKLNSWLFDFLPRSPLSRMILDENPHLRLNYRSPSSSKIKPIFISPRLDDNILLSPLIYQTFMNDYEKILKLNNNFTKKDISILSNTSFRSYYQYDKDRLVIDSNNNNNTNNKKNPLIIGSSNRSIPFSSYMSLPLNYIPPHYNPIPIDITDSRPYSQNVLPFLEVSLNNRTLGRDILHNLVDDPRNDVSATALLVASGAGLSGNVNGYFLCYSCVPETTHDPSPPPYMDNTDQNNTEDHFLQNSRHNDDGGLSSLIAIRETIEEAWTEYRAWTSRWNAGQESDTFSLAHSLRRVWKPESSDPHELKFNTNLTPVGWDPADKNSPPRIVIICTKTDHPRASKDLLERGRKLAGKWGVSFIALDSVSNLNVDVALSILIREASERRSLISH